MNRIGKAVSGALVLFAAVVASGCTQSPSEVLRSIEKCASKGDAVCFASHFTSDGRPFAEALVRIQKDVRRDEPTKAPIESMLPVRVISEDIQGDKATVLVAGPEGPAAMKFVIEDGAWKLDVAATEAARAVKEGALR